MPYQRLLARSAAAVLVEGLLCCNNTMLRLHLTVYVEQEGNAFLVWCRHDKDGDGKLTLKELLAATETNKNWMDAVLYSSVACSV
jgi:hypothetical protein